MPTNQVLEAAGPRDPILSVINFRLWLRVACSISCQLFDFQNLVFQLVLPIRASLYEGLSMQTQKRPKKLRNISSEEERNLKSMTNEKTDSAASPKPHFLLCLRYV